MAEWLGVGRWRWKEYQRHFEGRLGEGSRLWKGRERGATYAGVGQKPITLAEYSHWSCCQKKRVSSYNISYGLRSLISFVLSLVPIVVLDPLIPR